MSERFSSFSASCPANTPKATPQTTNITLPVANVDAIEVQVPAGAMGLAGLYIGCGTQQVIPYEAGQWLVWDDRTEVFELDAFPTAGQWEVVQYNTDDTYAHTVYLRFFLTYPAAPQPAPVAITVVTQPAPTPAPALVL